MQTAWTLESFEVLQLPEKDRDCKPWLVFINFSSLYSSNHTFPILGPTADSWANVLWAVCIKLTGAKWEIRTLFFKYQDFCVVIADCAFDYRGTVKTVDVDGHFNCISPIIANVLPLLLKVTCRGIKGSVSLPFFLPLIFSFAHPGCQTLKIKIF